MPKEPPLWKPRRNQRRLDFRPAIWSIRHRPEEWHIDGHLLVHKPSRMAIDVHYRWGEISYGPDASVHGRKVLGTDRWWFGLAFRLWKRKHYIRPPRLPSAMNLRFAAQILGSGGYQGEIKLPTGEVIYKGKFPATPDDVFVYMTAQRLAAE